MTDPYKVLNIPSTASDDEVKKAYRELARKYHPDNYHDNPLADLAQEKMKEINEAYELIQKQRKVSPGASGYANYGSYGSSASGNSVLQQVRLAINRGDITAAERLLASVSEHDAEWNFLMGFVASRRGWMDEAKRYFETAVSMEPNNPEYNAALDSMNRVGYRPSGFGSFGTANFDSASCLRICGTMACVNLLCGGGYYCLPCYF
ncbi:MAG: DnaJ domain-containing protein [Eubacteriales bacterium]|nr:DnaJ domain-containing protein [Eubacteriales bacterium]